MVEILQANWVAAAAILIAVLVAAWFLWLRKPAVRTRARSRDVLDEGAAPAARNSALIDSPPAAPIIPPAVSVGMAGIGEVISHAADEEIAAAAALQPAAEQGDDLSKIKGIGPKLRTLLNQLGITRYDQIAAMTPADLAALDGRLGAFAGRPVRDSWVEQARLLSAGDTGAYEAQFGKL